MTHVGLGPPGGIQHVNKHGGRPVYRGALLGLYCGHTGGPIEAGTGHHRGGPVYQTPQCGAHVTEAVIEGDGDTDSVRLEVTLLL